MGRIRDYIRAIRTGLSSDSTSDFYNRFSEYYDQTFSSQESVAADIVSYITECRERFDSALDIGCGTGIVTKNLEEICESVYGLDFSTGQLAQAEKKLENSCLINGDALKLPFDDGSFELVTTLGMIRHLHGREEEFAQEVYRVTKQNGLFVIDPEIIIPGLDLFYPLIKQTYARVYNQFMRWRGLDESVFARSTDEWADILADAGFDVIRERNGYKRDYIFVMGVKEAPDTPSDQNKSVQCPQPALPE